MDNIQFFDSGFLTEYENLLIVENIVASWTHKVNEIFDRNMPRSGDSITGRDLKEKIDRITEECANAIPINIGTQFRTKLSNSLNAEITAPLAAALKEIEGCLQGVFNDDSICVDKDINQLIADTLKSRASSFRPFYSDIVEKERRITSLGFKVNKHYNKAEHCDYLDIIKSYIIGEISSKLEEYKGIIKDNFKTLKDSYISELKQSISGYSMEYGARQKLVMAAIDEKINLMDEFIKDLNA